MIKILKFHYDFNYLNKCKKEMYEGTLKMLYIYIIFYLYVVH